MSTPSTPSPAPPSASSRTDSSQRLLTAHFRDLEHELTGFLIRRLGDRTEAEDVLQSAFVRAVKTFEKAGAPRDPRAWLYQVARHLSVDTLRKRRRDETLATHLASSQQVDLDGFPDDVPDVDGQVSRALARFLPRAIESLDPKYRDALRLVDLDQKPQSQAADELGVSLSALKSRVRRGRELLHGLLSSCCRFERDGRGKPVVCHPRTAAAALSCAACDEGCDS